MSQIKPILLGQAPSLRGDGRAFTGLSGKTVCRWLGVDDRDQLENYFFLDNLLPHPLIKNQSRQRKSSELTPAQARRGAEEFLGRSRLRVQRELGSKGWNDFIDHEAPITVVCLGNKVWRGFKLPSKVEWFHWEPVGDMFAMIKFPHPSGLNHDLNDPEFVGRVSTRLRNIALGRISVDDPTQP